VLSCSRPNSDQYRFCTKVVRLRSVFCTVGICARNFQSRFPLGRSVGDQVGTFAWKRPHF
jgi:hypothetical protein